MRTAALLAAASLALAAPAFAQQTATIQQETTLVLRGQAEVKVEPDHATINIGVHKEGKTAAEAMALQAEAMTAVLDALRKAGVNARDLQTGRVSLQPRYDYPRDKPAVLVAYAATNSVQATTRDLSKMGALLDASVTAGSNTINSIRFGVDNDEVPRREARALAVRDAMSKAEDYAKAMGYRVKRIVNVAEPGVNQAALDRVVVTGTRVSAVGAATTPIETGELTLYQTIEITFELTK